MPAKKSKCLSAGCRGVAKRRGLCHNCYAAAYRLVKTGKSSWEKLVKAGLCRNDERRRNPLSAAAAKIEGK